MSLFHLCLVVLGSLSLAILISLREPATGQHKSGVVQSYLTNPDMLRVLIEKQKKRAKRMCLPFVSSNYYSIVKAVAKKYPTDLPFSLYQLPILTQLIA